MATLAVYKHKVGQGQVPGPTKPAPVDPDEGIQLGEVWTVGSSTLSGAATGFKIGGPVGAAVGGGIGLIVGIAKAWD